MGQRPRQLTWLSVRESELSERIGLGLARGETTQGTLHGDYPSFIRRPPSPSIPIGLLHSPTPLGHRVCQVEPPIQRVWIFIGDRRAKANRGLDHRDAASRKGRHVTFADVL